MKRVGIIVEESFIHKHVGVRSLIFSMYRAFECTGNLVDFVLHTTNSNGLGKWRIISIGKQAIDNNYANVDLFSEGSANKVLSDFHSNSFRSQDNLSSKPDCLYTMIGSNINGHYDLLVLSAPWVYGPYLENILDPIYGIVYDMIPNQYVFENKNGPLVFAAQHNLGYSFLNRKAKKILNISEATKNNYLKWYPYVADKSVILPPAVPNYLIDIKCDWIKDKKEETNIILAGPFDVRKGLKALPSVLALLENKVIIDNLFIYGQPRCTLIEVDAFFKKIMNLTCIKKITWFREICSDSLRNLYSRSKLLIFPSMNEGLGLPLIEAQLCGCKVAATNFESALELLLDGSFLLTDDDKINADNLVACLIDDCNYLQMAKNAQKYFLGSNLLSFCNQIAMESQ